MSPPAPKGPPSRNARPADPPPARARLDDCTQTQVKWFFVRVPDALQAQEQAHWAWLCDAPPTLKCLYEGGQGFRRVLRERQAPLLPAWIAASRSSRIPEWGRFATGLLRELDWVVAAVTQTASNGPVEGHVNQLKLIKRTLYGSASFPLLRQRVLHAR